MFTKKIATVLILSAATVLPAFAFAAPSDSATHCILRQHRATAGLTAEWLQLSIQRHMVQMGSSGMKNCALDAKDVRVSVKSTGSGFAIEITGKDASQAQEILRRAKLLVG